MQNTDFDGVFACEGRRDGEDERQNEKSEHDISQDPG